MNEIGGENQASRLLQQKHSKIGNSSSRQH
jgi:hypothetical protein